MPVYATNVELALQQQQVIIAVERVVVVMREHRERGDGVELGGEKEVASLQLLLLRPPEAGVGCKGRGDVFLLEWARKDYQ